MRSRSRHALIVAVLIVVGGIPSRAAAIAVFESSIASTFVVQSSSPSVIVSDIVTASDSGHSATPIPDATASASATSGPGLTFSWSIAGQTGAILPAEATAFAEATLSFTLTNTDTVNQAPVTFALQSSGSFQISVSNPLLESARLDSFISIALEGEPDPLFELPTTIQTPPNVDSGPLSGSLVLQQLILFPNVSGHFTVSFSQHGVATATGTAGAVPEPSVVLLLVVGIGYSLRRTVTSAALPSDRPGSG